MTPFEVAFGIKPELKGVHEWGEKVYIRVEGGTKLGEQVREGRWLGLDDKLKGAQIYWPDTKNVTVEQNISYDNTLPGCFEEELEAITISKTTNNSPNIVAPNTNIEPPASNVEDSDIEPSKQI